jgi:hypothetical protein
MVVRCFPTTVASLVVRSHSSPFMNNGLRGVDTDWSLPMQTTDGVGIIEKQERAKMSEEPFS